MDVTESAIKTRITRSEVLPVCSLFIYPSLTHNSTKLDDLVANLLLKLNPASL